MTEQILIDFTKELGKNNQTYIYWFILLKSLILDENYNINDKFFILMLNFYNSSIE